MPHGPITPLGRQLRSVLAALRPTIRDAGYPRLGCGETPSIASTSRDTGGRPSVTIPLQRARRSQDVRRGYSSVAVAIAHDEQSLDEPGSASTSQPRREYGRKRRKLQSANLGQELRNFARHDIAPDQKIRKGRLSESNVRSRDRWKQWYKNKRKSGIPTDGSRPTPGPKLLNILARYIRQLGETSDHHAHDVAFTPQLHHDDLAYLSDKGYGPADLKLWADIVTEQDSLEAASIIRQRIATEGLHTVPLPVVSYVLLRPYISAQALRILCVIGWDHLAKPQSALSKPYSADAVFTFTNRLVRHARSVWPQALSAIAERMLQYLPEASAQIPNDDPDALPRMTYMLNKMMYLISEPTAVAPHKDNEYQEAAVVRILAFMTDTTPNLQLNLEGYRAVIRIQLAQRKTPNERQWADLKALSWPPWKEDRTSMDSEILPEHGISRAGETLRRMQEAGYGPGTWEQVAELYTGWDIDGTPTIQTRAILPSSIDDADSEVMTWEARIRTTRTVQEAWACYLAFEDTGLPPHPNVLLAILDKLSSEEKAQRRREKPHICEFQSRRSPREKLLPGDTPEVSPLPPSTHLYTYTRTPPPSIHEFFTQLREDGIRLDAACLAFLVSNATTFRHGLEYLRHGRRTFPAIEGLLSPRSSISLDRLPGIMFEAYIKLLARFPDTTLRVQHEGSLHTSGMFSKRHLLTPERLNMQHGIVRAMGLLDLRKPRSRVGWNAVLLALSGDRCFAKAHLARGDPTTLAGSLRPDPVVSGLAAFKLMQQVIDSMQSQYLDLDVAGFLALCRATERVAMTSWRALLQDTQSIDTMSGTSKKSEAIQDAKQLLTRQKPHWRLEQFFKVLVGEESYLDPKRQPGGPPVRRLELVAGLPRLLTIPGPAMLHAYIRALGWCGAHERLVSTVKWMIEYKTELAEARVKDRNGEVVMRRAVVALRVFLERSWMDERSESDTADFGSWSRQTSVALRRLEAAAPREVVEEARELVERVEEWGGWPEDEEMEDYCTDERFEPFR